MISHAGKLKSRNSDCLKTVIKRNFWFFTLENLNEENNSKSLETMIEKNVEISYIGKLKWKKKVIIMTVGKL